MPNDKLSSIKWAIDELSKQKDELESKLAIARKRDETSSLISEVHAQKDALEKRISALEDGLKASTELVQIPASNLESEISEIDQKLEIAQERLDNLEQEEYFEELGRKLTGKHEESPSEEKDADSHTELSKSTSNEVDQSLPLTKPLIEVPETAHSTDQLSQSSSTQTSTMKSTSRMHETEPNLTEADRSRLPDTDQTEEKLEKTAPSEKVHQSGLSLESTALALGVDAEFLSEKSIQAILRMISRNGGKLSFPLEVEQID